MRFVLLTLAAVLATSSCTHAPAVENFATSQRIWRFDRLDQVGNARVRIEGNPRLVDSGAGAAIAFDGIDDAMLIEEHPLAGAATFTIEAVFRPDGGDFEQRWLHLAEADPESPSGTYPPVKPNGPRFLFEIRVVPGGWYLDAFTAGPGYSQALMAPEKLHPLGRWYHVAQTYDGRTYRSYVDGRLQAQSALAFRPQGPGYSSVGTRINRRSYFRGAVYAARFTPRALAPQQFMNLPERLARSPAGRTAP